MITWHQFLQGFQRWPSIHRFLLTTLLMATSKRELERFQRYGRKSNFYFTREDFHALEEVWTTIFKAHRPRTPWEQSKEDLSGVVLLATMLPLDELEVSDYYWTCAVRKWRTEHLETEVVTESPFSEHVSTFKSRRVKKVCLGGKRLEPTLSQTVLLGDDGNPARVHVGLEIDVPRVNSLKEAEKFIARFGQFDKIILDDRSGDARDNYMLLNVWWTITGDNVASLMGTLVRLGENSWKSEDARFHNMTFTILQDHYGLQPDES